MRRRQARTFAVLSLAVSLGLMACGNAATQGQKQTEEVFADGNLIFVLIFADGNAKFYTIFADGNLIFCIFAASKHRKPWKTTS